MADRVHITSLEAISRFRSRLIVYADKAKRAVDEAADDARQVKLWLENEQRLHLQHRVRQRTRELERLEQELLTAKFSKFRDSVSREQAAVKRAKEALREAEMKLKILKQWNRTFDSRVAPLAKRLERLRDILEHDLPRGAAYLENVRRTLEDYAAAPPPEGGAVQGAAPAESESSEGGSAS